MSWLVGQERLTLAARLLIAPPEEVYRELKQTAGKQRSELFLRDDKIEAALVERNQPLINLGLACFGTNKEVFKALYRHSLEPPLDGVDAEYSFRSAAWSVDRLGRSLQHLVGLLNELQALNCHPYLHQQAVDTTTPSGLAMFQMCGVFAEFERAMIVERVNSGLARAKAKGVKLGRGKKTDGERCADEVRWGMGRAELEKRILRLYKGGGDRSARQRRELATCRTS